MSTNRARKLAKTLNFEHNKKGRTWRQIAQDYPDVHFATLNRIAKSGGTWLPSSEYLLERLGMIGEYPKPAWLKQAVSNLEQLREAKLARDQEAEGG